MAARVPRTKVRRSSRMVRIVAPSSPTSVERRLNSLAPTGGVVRLQFDQERTVGVEGLFAGPWNRTADSPDFDLGTQFQRLGRDVAGYHQAGFADLAGKWLA